METRIAVGAAGCPCAYVPELCTAPCRTALIRATDAGNLAQDGERFSGCALKAEGAAARQELGNGVLAEASPYRGQRALIAFALNGCRRDAKGVAERRCRPQQADRSLGVCRRCRQVGDALEAVDEATLVPQLPHDEQALFVAFRRPAVIALVGDDLSEFVEREGDAALVLQLPVELQALGMQRLRPRMLTQLVRHGPKVVQRGGDAVLATERSPDRQALVPERRRAGVVGLHVGDGPQVVQRHGNLVLVAQLSPDR